MFRQSADIVWQIHSVPLTKTTKLQKSPRFFTMVLMSLGSGHKWPFGTTPNGLSCSSWVAQLFLRMLFFLQDLIILQDFLKNWGSMFIILIKLFHYVIIQCFLRIIFFSWYRKTLSFSQRVYQWKSWCLEAPELSVFFFNGGAHSANTPRWGPPWVFVGTKLYLYWNYIYIYIIY